MSNPESQFTEATQSLSALNNDELFSELAGRVKGMEADLAMAGNVDKTPVVEVESLGLEGLQNFGRKFFERVNRQAFELICGDGEDVKEDRDKIFEAIKLNPESGAALLATLLVAHLGLAPLLAPVIAILIVRLVFKPAHESLCESWKESFDGPA